MALELTPQQLAVLERIAAAGFTFVAYPLYANYVAARRAECAALLQPVTGGGMSVYGKPFWLVSGQPSVRVNRAGRSVFVWKKQEVEVTPEREAALAAFARDLAAALELPPQ